MTAIHTTFQLRAYLAKGKHVRLEQVLRDCATLYNAAKQERMESYGAPYWGFRLKLDDGLS